MTEGTHLQKRGRRALIVGIILLLIIALVVALVVALRPEEKPQPISSPDVSDSDCIDVAVIGGGIGGAYTAWKLRDRGLSISVFEYTDRVGGRLMAKEFPAATGTYLELGGMRFQAGAHPILTQTATEIGLNVIPFELGYGNSDETIWYTRGKRLRNTDLGTSNMPYNLAPGELTDPDTLIWNTLNNNINLSSNTYPSLDEMYTLSTHDGVPLYKMSMDAFYGRYISREAYKYIQDTSGWADSVGPNGALLIPKLWAVFPGPSGPSDPYKTIEGGMDLVPKTLMQKFLEANSTSHKLHLNRQLLRIEKRRGGGSTMTIKSSMTIDGVTTPVDGSEMKMCARKVVLTGHKRSIQDIDFPIFTDNKDFTHNLDSLVDYPAGRIYLAYNSSWWKNGNADITHTKSDLPNRQSYEWQTGSNNVSIIMASYHDGDLVRYWRELSHIGRPIPGSLSGANGVSEEVKRHMEKYLASIFDIKTEDIPEAVGGGMMLWDTYPHYAAWSYFKPGYDERIVREKLAKPSSSDHVYIVGNSWSADDLQGWSEGSLISADYVLNKYF